MAIDESGHYGIRGLPRIGLGSRENPRQPEGSGRMLRAHAEKLARDFRQTKHK